MLFEKHRHRVADGLHDNASNILTADEGETSARDGAAEFVRVGGQVDRDRLP